jgi:RNA polymerase sigma-70 factor, ECF subfamily
LQRAGQVHHTVEVNRFLGMAILATGLSLFEDRRMGLAGNMENLIRKSVFRSATSVCESNMSTATLILAEQARSENVLVAEGLKRHDPELLDQLILQYQHRLLRYLLYLSGNREMAEDLFQETWMRVLMRGSQFNGNSRFDTWLFTIARNLVIDLRRKRSMASLEEMCEAGDEDRPFEVPSADKTPFDHLQTSENGQLVSDALLTLDPLHREVLVLRFHEEMSLEEIARFTRAPLSTVKSRLYRGLAALRPRIEEAMRTTPEATAQNAPFPTLTSAMASQEAR